MKSKKFSVMLGIIFCALIVQAQDSSLDEEWDSVPTESEATQNSDDEFSEFEEKMDLDAAAPSTPAPESTADVPPPVIEPEVSVPPAPEIAPAPEPDLMQAQAPSMESSPAEPPDYSKETRFHNIYKKYNESETPVEAWEQAVGARRSETYEVQKGDTLSGISTTFFGDQFFWPKIWSLNSSEILNPHEITPGMIVKFYPGSAGEAPTLQLGEEAGQEGEASEAEQAATGEVDEEAIAAAAEQGRLSKTPPTSVDVAVTPQMKAAQVAIPPAKKRAPLLRSLPASLPLYKRIPDGAIEVDLASDISSMNFPSASEYLSYYIADEPLDGVGIITGAELNMKAAGEYQYVFVQIDGTAGKEYVVQKNLAMISDPTDKGREGQMVEVQGEIEVLEKVNSKKNVYRAIVKKAIQPVEVGSVVTAGKIPMVTMSGQKAAVEVSAKIMGGQFEKKRSLFGTNTLVFLDSGKEQGLQEGQRLSIYADERVRNKKTDSLENDRIIGELQIVKVTENFSTGYIVKAIEDIVVGDYVGKAGMQARVDDVDFEDEPEFKNEEPDDSFDELPPVEDDEMNLDTEEGELEL